MERRDVLNALAHLKQAVDIVTLVPGERGSEGANDRAVALGHSYRVVHETVMRFLKSPVESTESEIEA